MDVPTPDVPKPGIGGGGGGDGVGCTSTAPSALSATRDSPTSATLQWTPGANGAYQALWVSTDSDPQTGCAGSLGGTSVCPVRQDSGTTPLPSTTSSYAIDNILSPGTVYYWEVVNVESATCYGTGYSGFMSSCSLSPSSLTITQGTAQTVTSSAPSGGAVNNVAFISSSPANLTVNPSSDASYPYQTLATGVLAGASSITSNVYMFDGSLGCSQITPATVLPPLPWWQVKDSDISSRGDLTSVVPAGKFFGLPGPGGYSGIAAYSGGTNLTSADVSQNGWIANSTVGSPKVYGYHYFSNQIPADTVISTLSSNVLDQTAIDANITPSYGYYWYKYDGSASGLDLKDYPFKETRRRET